MNKILSAILVLSAAVCLADDTYIKGRVNDNGNLIILGVDNVEREAVVLSPTEYASLTNAMLYLSSIKEYRARIHGNVVSRVVDPEKKAVVYRYSDGFTWSEPMLRYTGNPSKPTHLLRTDEEKPHAMSDAQWQALKKKRAKKTTREVNATYSPGGNLKSVAEDSK